MLAIPPLAGSKVYGWGWLGSRNDSDDVAKQYPPLSLLTMAYMVPELNKILPSNSCAWWTLYSFLVDLSFAALACHRLSSAFLH